MKYLKKEEKSKPVGLIIAVVVLSAAILVLVALLLWPKSKNLQVNSPLTTVPSTEPFEVTEAENPVIPTQAENPVIPTEAENPVIPTEADIVETQPSETVSMRIDTPYCELYFPAEWEAQITTTVNQYDGGCAVAFSGSVEDKQAYLFVVLFEEGEKQGNAVGYITTETGNTIWVYVEMNEQLTDATWTQEQADEIMTMQEGINHLLTELAQNVAFSAVN